MIQETPEHLANSMKACERKWLLFFSQFCYWPPLERGHKAHTVGLLFGLTQCCHFDCWCTQCQQLAHLAAFTLSKWVTAPCFEADVKWNYRYMFPCTGSQMEIQLSQNESNFNIRLKTQPLSFLHQLFSSAFTVIHIHY